MRRLKSFIDKYFTSEYKKGFVYIFSSKILIIAVTFLTTPILARIYNPGDYGLFALLNSLALMISLFSSLTLPTSLLVAGETKIIRTVTGILGYMVLVNSLILMIGIGFVSSFNSVAPLNLNLLMVILVVVSSFLLSTTQVFANLNIRDKAFRKNVVVNIIDNFATRASSLSFGFIGITKYGLFFSDLLGKSINLLSQLYFRKFSFSTFFDAKFFNLKNFWLTILENKEYPQYNLPVLLIGSFSGQLILWILALVFSQHSIGYFAMATGLLNIPLLLISNSFQPLITSKLFNESKSFSSDTLARLYGKIFLISVSIYSIIYFLAPYFVKIYLGNTWLPSVKFIQVLCIPYLLQMFSNSIGGAFIVFNKQKINFVIKLIFLVLAVTGFSYYLQAGSDLEVIVIFYSTVLSFEELSRITYLVLQLNHVRNLRVLR